jgi:DNA-binding CsgD family transcriptional regulator
MGGVQMGVRHAEREELRRLESKTLDARFRAILENGLNCSPFEAEAVVAAVKEVYFPSLQPSESGGNLPGYITVVAVNAEEPAGKPVRDCQKQTVHLLLHRGSEDDTLLQRQGAAAFRRARLTDLCQQALSQGALLTREDLAYRIFFAAPRTISRDLAELRRRQPNAPIPLRSMVQDIGPVLTHRVQIVRLALEGKTTTQICDVMHHSPAAVTNYVSTFTRCAQLAERGLQEGQIAFLLRRGRGLIQSYLKLLEACKKDSNFQYHLNELLAIGHAGEKEAGGRADA